MQHPPLNPSEDVIAEKVLQRAQISRISRQLKLRLAQASVRARCDLLAAAPRKSAVSSLPASSLPDRRLLPLLKRLLDLDPTEPESEHLPMKKHTLNPTLSNMPLLPIYATGARDTAGHRLEPPKTPPPFHRKVLLHSTVLHGLDEKDELTAATDHVFSTPKALTRGMGLLATPSRGDDDEGADLLMFLATLPLPATYRLQLLRDLPTTPKHSLIMLLHTTLPAAEDTKQTLAMTALALGAATISTITRPSRPRQPTFVAPATPKRTGLKQLGDLMRTPGRGTTPSFNMNDYVNFFTPLPRAAKAQGDAAPSTPGRIVNFDRFAFGTPGRRAGELPFRRA